MKTALLTSDQTVAEKYSNTPIYNLSGREVYFV